MCPCVDVVDVASLCTLFVLSLVHFSLSTLLSCRTRLCIHSLTPTHNHVIVLFLAARFALWLYLYLFLSLTFCLFVCVFVCLCSFPPACRSVLWWWWADRVSTPSERALFHGPQMARSRFFHYWWFFLFILGWSINNEQNNNDDPSIQEQSLQTAQEPSVQSVPENPRYSSLSPQLSRLMKVCVCALFWPPSIIISTQFFFFSFWLPFSPESPTRSISLPLSLPFFQFGLDFDLLSFSLFFFPLYLQVPERNKEEEEGSVERQPLTLNPSFQRTHSRKENKRKWINWWTNSNHKRSRNHKIKERSPIKGSLFLPNYVLVGLFFSLTSYYSSSSSQGACPVNHPLNELLLCVGEGEGRGREERSRLIKRKWMGWSE